MIGPMSFNRTGSAVRSWLCTSPAERNRTWPAGRDSRHCGSAGRRRPPWLGQIARYSAVGAFNTALDAGLYLLLTHWLGLSGLRILAKGISYGVGTLNSFHWNRSWTFRSSVAATTTFAPFLLVSIVALAVNAAAMDLFLELFAQHETPALIVATGLTLLWNFSVNKYIVFKR